MRQQEGNDEERNSLVMSCKRHNMFMKIPVEGNEIHLLMKREAKVCHLSPSEVL